MQNLQREQEGSNTLWHLTVHQGIFSIKKRKKDEKKK